MICKVCANVDLDVLDSFDGYTHHPSVKSLQDSGSSGCESCILIRQAHRELEGGLLDETWCGSVEDTQITMRMVDSGMIEVSQIERRKHQKPDTRPFLSCIVNLCAEADDPLAARILRRPVSLPLASLDSFYTASQWLRACLQHHTDCIPSGGEYQLPARVIDVGPPDGSGMPFLFSTDDRFGQWVALSHCWGKVDPLKTTLETIKTHEESLPMRSLPPLFRDAVLITRRLGYRYLWIDSLCIIQDSKADWQTESAHMGNIYSNAVFTIAAEAACDGEESILKSPRAAVVYPIKIPCRAGDLEGHIILYHSRYDIKGPLGKRAWTLQEDVLSPRVLRWGADQLTWHCRTVTCSEHDPTGAFNIDPKGYSSNERLYRQPHYKLLCLSTEALEKRMQSHQALGSANDYRLSVLSFWNSIVQEFASRALTYETDRLPALSGVAKEVAKHTRYTYKAGLWEEVIHSDLLWRIDGQTERPTTYTAPSWTWAGYKLGHGEAKLSTMGTKFRLSGSHPVAEVVSVNLIYIGPDPYGQVSSGELVLRAPCMQVLDWATCSSRLDCLPDAEPNLFSTIFCVQILSFPARKWFSALRMQHFEGEICCLLLENADDRKDLFRRIGTARIPAKACAAEPRIPSLGQWFSGGFRRTRASDLVPSEVWTVRTIKII